MLKKSPLYSTPFEHPASFIPYAQTSEPDPNEQHSSVRTIAHYTSAIENVVNPTSLGSSGKLLLIIDWPRRGAVLGAIDHPEV